MRTSRAHTSPALRVCGQVAVHSVANALSTQSTLNGQDGADSCVLTEQAIRRLTPRECERLQGVPDDWTLVPFRHRAMGDGPRYRMLGNSCAVPVIRWIGARIAAAHAGTTPDDDRTG
jgi:site-specific DNA-cytosine methylase